MFLAYKQQQDIDVEQSVFKMHMMVSNLCLGFARHFYIDCSYYLKTKHFASIRIREIFGSKAKIYLQHAQKLPSENNFYNFLLYCNFLVNSTQELQQHSMQYQVFAACMNYNFWDFARILNGSLFMMTLYNGEAQTKNY